MPTQADLDAIRWYHEFDFPGRLTARSREPDVADHRRIWAFIETQLASVDLAGKSVLDIGAWDGYFSFLAERRGAMAVLAADDMSQNWGSGAGIETAKTLFQSRIETKLDQSVYALGALNRTFDVIFCFGVYYHLLDPLLAFAQIRHCCHDESLVLFEGDIRTDRHDLSATYGFGDSRLPAFLPTEPLLRQMLAASYLRVEKIAFQRDGHVWKSAVKAALRQPHKERVFVAARPFRGANALHEYAPPYGLKVYGA
jgi:tRNA (mo5U34)-methyltransferase